MADWATACSHNETSTLLECGDLDSLPSTRLLNALETERRAKEALRAKELRERRGKAAKRLQVLHAPEHVGAVRGVARHFETLAGAQSAIQDALQPLPDDSTLWLDRDLHHRFASFIKALPQTRQLANDPDIEWSASLKHDPKILAARSEEATVAYETLKQSFDIMCQARDAMRNVERHSAA